MCSVVDKGSYVIMLQHEMIFIMKKLQFSCFVCLQESQVRQTDRYLDVTHAPPQDKAISIEVS